MRKRKGIFAFISGILFACSSLCFGGGPKKISDFDVVIPYLNAKPSDERLAEDSFWRQAKRIDFPAPENASGKFKVSTSAQIIASQHSLFLKFICRGNMEEKAVQPKDAVDASLWKEPSIEMFFRPSFANDDCFQIIVNKNGAVFDACHSVSSNSKEATAWNSAQGIQRSISAKPGEWTLFARIPWQVFGLDSAPRRGFVWRLKFARNIPDAGIRQNWPLDDSGSNLSILNSGYFVWGNRNLLENSDFERKGFYWGFAKGPGGKNGEMLYLKDAAFEGNIGLRLIRDAPKGYYPQIWSRPLRLQSNSVYRLSAETRGKGEAFFRWNGIKGKMGKPFKLCADWKDFSTEINVPDYKEDTRKVFVGFQLSRPGEMDVDNFTLERINGKKAGKPLKKAHPLHNLEELAKQRPCPPYGLLYSNKLLDCQPLYITDSATGHTLIRLAREGIHRYSDISPWNSNGSILAFNKKWKGQKSLWFMDMGTGFAKKCPFYSSRYIWDRNNPQKLYVILKGDLCVFNPKTEALKTLASFGNGNINVMPQSFDGKMLLVSIHKKNAGKTATTLYWIKASDGKIVKKYQFTSQLHAVWFIKDGKYTVMYNYQDRKLSDLQHYLTMDDKITTGPMHGHMFVAPGGGKLAKSAGGAVVMNLDASDPKRMLPHPSQHIDWSVTPEWFLSSAPRGIFRVWTDRRNHFDYLASPNSDLYGFRTYTTENHVAASFDGSKAAYGSQMLGTLDLWCVIVAPSLPPSELSLTKENDKTILSWKKPLRSREIINYNIYGCVGNSRVELLATVPSDVLNFALPQPKNNSSYFVTGLEAVGLEGRPSSMISVNGKISPVPEELFKNRFKKPKKPMALKSDEIKNHVVKLSWTKDDAEKSPGFWFYRVFRGEKEDFKPSQKNLVGTPKASSFIDWGLFSDKEYYYRVASVNMNGIQGEVSDALKIKTNALKNRIFVEKNVDKKIKEEGEKTEIKFTIPSSARCVAWLEVSPLKQSRYSRLEAILDKKKLGVEKISFSIIGKGHSGGKPGYYMWTKILNPVSYGLDKPGIELEKGEHSLVFRGSGSPLLIRKIVFTNDLNWTPNGIWSWLPSQKK